MITTLYFAYILGQGLIPHCSKTSTSSSFTYLTIIFVGWDYKHVMGVVISATKLVRITVLFVLTI